MSADAPPRGLDPRYLAKATGLALAALLLIGAGDALAQQPLPPSLRIACLSALILLLLALPWWAARLLPRREELQQMLHREACTRSVPWLFSGLAVIGILQRNAVLPLFDQLWTVLALLMLWGLNLMLADRPHH